MEVLSIIELCDGENSKPRNMKVTTLEQGADGIRIVDYDSFEALYDQHALVLIRIAAKKLGDLDQAMDVVQDLFVDLWQRRFKVQIKTSVQNFLVSSLYFKIFQHFRNEGLSKRHIEHFTLLQSIDSPLESAIVEDNFELEYQHTIAHISEAVEHMPERMREVFQLKYYQSYSNQEIAQKLGISIQTVKNQLSRSLDLIRRELPAQMAYSTVPVLPMLVFFLQ